MSIKFVFYGTSEFSVFVLEALKKNELVPSLIVSTPDKAQGRKMEIKPTLAKIWAEQNGVLVFQPNKLDDEAFDFLRKFMGKNSIQVAIVASYGKIIPQRFLDLSPHKTLNAHPSLLPKYRGASPLESQILADEKEVGTSIMILDAEMDHGDILDQVKYGGEKFPVREIFEEKMGELSGDLLAKILPDYLVGKVQAVSQKHNEATFTKKIEKTEAEINWSDLQDTGKARQNFLKIQAYSGWPNVFTWVPRGDEKIRVIIKSAEFKNGELVIKRVIPEGKKEMDYQDFLRGLKQLLG